MDTAALCASPGVDVHLEAFRVEGAGYLATSPELAMKRLLAAGAGRIFQFAHAFRRGERGDRHSPEFGMLEWYRPGADYRDLMRETEELVRAAERALSAAGIETQSSSWLRPLPRLSVDDAFSGWAGWTPSAGFDGDRFFLDLVDKVEPELQRMGAVFLFDYPAPTASLARLKPGAPELAERFELYLGGLEICNGFSELTDPREHRDRLARYSRERRDLGREPFPVDESFLAAVDRGLPESAGNALGVDRLLMALAGAGRIEEPPGLPPVIR